MRPSSESSLRFAILGCGASIVPTHLNALAELSNAQIVGMCDIDAERGSKRAAEADCPFFLDERTLLAELHPDVVVICTPHPCHTQLALTALAAVHPGCPRIPRLPDPGAASPNRRPLQRLQRRSRHAGCDSGAARHTGENLT